jgi:hypothetical protein
MDRGGCVDVVVTYGIDDMRASEPYGTILSADLDG